MIRCNHHVHHLSTQTHLVFSCNHYCRLLRLPHQAMSFVNLLTLLEEINENAAQNKRPSSIFPILLEEFYVPHFINPATAKLSLAAVLSPRWQKQKVVVVLGATGTGKSKLAIDIAVCFGGEIINSDKMQVHQGLPILTNKVTDEECRGVPHHLLGILQPHVDFTVADFCDYTTRAAEDIAERGKIPIIAGGSNTYIEALVDKTQHKFDFVFFWLDVSVPVLHTSVSDRVDKMVELGLVEEARGAFQPDADYSKGIRKSIGVPEFDHYFRNEETLDEAHREESLRIAIEEVKSNTKKLVKNQMEKINRFRCVKGWKLHRIDATAVFGKRGGEKEAAWLEIAVAPSVAVVRQFLSGELAGVFSPIHGGATASVGKTVRQRRLALAKERFAGGLYDAGIESPRGVATCAS